MDENGRPAGTGSFIFDLREIISQVRREADERKVETSDSLRGTTEIRVHPIVKTNWAQRVSIWFRRD